MLDFFITAVCIDCHSYKELLIVTASITADFGSSHTKHFHMSIVGNSLRQNMKVDHNNSLAVKHKIKYFSISKVSILVSLIWACAKDYYA